MPWTYRHGDKEWRRFLDDIREVMSTPSDNVAYTTAQGVLAAFRARLTVAEAAAFAQVLPAMVRALFFEGWVPEAPNDWADRQTYTAEARALRADHNFATVRALEAVSVALHRALGAPALEAALDRIGPEARAFWALEGYSEADLARHGF